MIIHLASENRDVYALCQQVLGEVVGRGWTLHIARHSHPECQADLYIWDTENKDSRSLQIPFDDLQRHFFLVDRAEVGSFRTLNPSLDGHILLKPLSCATLRAFLTDACKRADNRKRGCDSMIDSLRADRDELLQSLIQANLKLQEYDHDRTNFLARSIHDFRAPLTAINGYCGLLLGDDLGDLSPLQKEILERVHRSARKLSRMAAAMFQLSIAPRAEVAPELKPASLRETFDRAMDEILPVAHDKNISVDIELASAPGTLAFEPRRMEQVITNLLDNACKFTPKAGRISIKGYPFFWDRRGSCLGGGSTVDRRSANHRAANSYRVDVADTGPGIPASELLRIFEEYMSNERGMDRTGGGLGLAICRMIIGQHGGKIWAENAPGGAVFSFVLPLQPIATASPAADRPVAAHAAS